VVHLHHLTPIHQAAQDLWPDVPVISHIHGTELKMLALAAEAPTRRSSMWVERLRRWAAASQRLVVVSQQDRDLTVQLLGVEPDRITTIANGVDTDVFSVRELSGAASRRAAWQQWLVDDPRGWKPGEGPGSIRYRREDLAAFDGDDGELVPVILFAGRFMQFKRLQLLIEAHDEMRRAGHPPCVLVIAGGFPGEWEGEHPYDTVQRLSARGVFFLGWRDHHDLAEILGCVDVFAAPSVDEPFGLVYLEAMAAGVAPIATATGGPLSFINVDPHLPTGWLVAPDDRSALVAALVEAVSDEEQLSSRGKRAAHFVGEHYSWSRAARSFVDLYDTVVDEAGISGRSR
jgi:glycosyltransferase involved in cell wall biosynthesis